VFYFLLWVLKKSKEVIDLKLDVARQTLIKNQRKNIFPIIAYSYYEYAKSLQNYDKPSALLFAEYALELSNLDIYFTEKKMPVIKKVKSPPKELFIFLIMLGIGGLIIANLLQKKKPKHRTRSRK